MFAANRDPKEPIARIGMGGQLLPQSLLFAKGRTFVEIVETDGSAAGNQRAALQAFAAKIAPLLEGREAPPEALQWFPPEHQTSIALVPESVLGLVALKRGFVAEDPSRDRPLLSWRSRPRPARLGGREAFRERFAGVAPVPIADEAFAGKVPLPRRRLHLPQGPHDRRPDQTA